MKVPILELKSILYTQFYKTNGISSTCGDLLLTPLVLNKSLPATIKKRNINNARIVQVKFSYSSI